MGINSSIDFLPDTKHLSVVDKSAFAVVLGQYYNLAYRLL